MFPRRPGTVRKRHDLSDGERVPAYAPGLATVSVRPLRVIALSSYGLLGGAELSLATFAEHRPPGIEIEAVLLEDGPLRARLEALGIAVVSARGHGGPPGLRALARFAREFGRLLDRRRPDVVWATGIKAALMAAAPCRRRGVALAWHKVDFSYDARLALPVGAACTTVIGVSNAVTEALGPIRERRVAAIIGPPVRLAPEVLARPDHERPLIGTVGRLVPYKGHDRILRAAALVAREVPGVRVVLAGGAAPEAPGHGDELRRLADELGLADRLEMPGFVPAEGVLEGLSVFVTATYRDANGFGFEGLSGAMLEAGWAGVPVVAARGGGTAEGLVDGVTGTLVDHAEPELLAAAMLPYLTDRELAARTAGAARAHVRERHAPDALAARLFAALASAAGHQKGTQ